MEIKIKQLHKNAKPPCYATDGAGCFDLFAATVDGYAQHEQAVRVGLPLVCGTGLAFEIPEGYIMLIFSRSGHGFKRETRLANCVGAIDSDYRGEVLVKLTRDLSMNDDLVVRPGDSIAQALIVKADRHTFRWSEELSSTERGAGGFGSTDEKKGGV